MTDENKKNKKIEKHQHRVNEHELDAELKEIYRDPDGHIPDMSTLEYTKGFAWSKKLITAFLILASMAGAAWAGFLIFKSATPFTSKNVSLDIKAPFTTISGDQYEYIISLTNKEPLDIERGLLTVNLPYGFFLSESNLPFRNTGESSSKPANIYNWDIPFMLSGDVLNLSLKGQFIGEKEIRPLMSATFKYSPKNVSSTFEASSSFSTDIADSILAITSDYATQAIQDQEQTFTIRLKNISESQSISNLKMTFEIPETFKDFSLKASSTNKEFDKNAPNIEEEDAAAQTQPVFVELSESQTKQFNETKSISILGLAAGHELAYTVTGKFQVEENGEQQVKIQAFAADSKENFLLQASEELAVQVIKGDLITDLIINGKTDNQPVSFGGKLNYLLHIKNKSKTALGDINIRILIDSPAIDWTTLEDPSKGMVSDNQILWTQKEVKGLNVLLPEGEVDINFSISLKDYAQLNSYKSGELNIRSYYQATVNKVEQLNSTKTFDSKTITNPLNSNSQLTVLGRYFDEHGETVGSGPLPPVVGQTTTYQILWKIENSFNELTDITVSSELPAGVSFTDAKRADAGDIQTEGSKITWSINRMPTSVQAITAMFAVSLTPEAKDANKLLSLLKETSFTATDKETGGTISISGAPLTTDLSGDTNAQGKGLVKPE